MLYSYLHTYVYTLQKYSLRLVFCVLMLIRFLSLNIVPVSRFDVFLEMIVFDVLIHEFRIECLVVIGYVFTAVFTPKIFTQTNLRSPDFR